MLSAKGLVAAPFRFFRSFPNSVSTLSTGSFKVEKIFGQKWHEKDWDTFGGTDELRNDETRHSWGLLALIVIPLSLG